MRCLICGIGSIGQRHFKNLVMLGQEIAIYRSRSTETPFISNFMREQESAGQKIRVFYNLDEALEIFRPSIVFVTNPNALHMEVAIPAAKFGSHLFIEKPISHNFEGIEELRFLVDKNKLKVMVGYNLRFHPLLCKMKEMLTNGVIGLPLSAHIEMGENVEDWHTWEDYSETYSVWKKKGGGATLCFSHDIDYAHWFFGYPQKIFSIGGRITPLLGDAEDTVKVLMGFDSGLIISLHLDYWQRPKTRTFKIVGIEGVLFWDYDAGELTLIDRKSGDKKVYFVPSGFERNHMFIEEIKSLVSCIEKDEDTAISLADGVRVLDIIQAIKKGLSC